MSVPVTYAGRGTQLLYSADNITFLPVNQLQQFEPDSSKQTIVDQTNILSGNFAQPLAVQVTAGDISFAGILNPQDASYLALLGFHRALTLAWWRAILVDGTVFAFQAYVVDFKPFSVKFNKLYGWSGKLRVAGSL